MVVYPIIYRVFIHVRWLALGFLNHQQYHRCQGFKDWLAKEHKLKLRNWSFVLGWKRVVDEELLTKNGL